MKNKKSFRIGFYLFTIIILFIIIFPFFSEIIASLKTSSDITKPFKLIPSKFAGISYNSIFDNQPRGSSFGKFLLNSFVVSSITTLISIAVAFFAAYAIARLNFKGKKVALGFFIAVLVIPAISIISPIYKFMKDTGLENSYLSLIIPYLSFALPLAILNLTFIFKKIPYDLEEAAIIEGASMHEAITKIFLPIATPGILITGILVFIASWNEFLFSMTINTKDISKTATAAISNQLTFGEIGAAAIVISLPIILLVFIFQKRMISRLIGETKES